MNNLSSFAIIVIILLSCDQQEKTAAIPEKPVIKPKKLVLTYSPKKVSSMVRYMHQKQQFDASGKTSDHLIKQVLVDLTSNRSITVPEIPKLHLITGILFHDLENEKKSLEYYQLEIKMSESSEKTGLEEALKQNWRRSKIEALILLDKPEAVKEYLAQLKRRLTYQYYREVVEYSKFKKEDIYSSYSLKIVRNEDLNVILL